MSISKRILAYLPGIILFIIFLIMGLVVYNDYGISWDEPLQRNLGAQTWDYIFGGNRDLFQSRDRCYGPAFELPLMFIERAFHLTDTRDVYLARHLTEHVLFLLSALSFYILAYRLFRNRFIAVLAFLLIACFPRFYAHSFFNSKDTPLMAMFIISFTAIQVAFEKHRPLFFLIAGLVCGYTASVRIIGFILVAPVLLFLLLDRIQGAGQSRSSADLLKKAGVFIGAFLLSFFVWWPFLWSAPVHNFNEIFQLINEQNSTRLTYQSGHQSWTYLPFWLSITTPILWLICGAGGLVWVVIAFFKKPMSFVANTQQRNYLLYLYCFFGPVFIVIYTNSFLYNDWRHLYFIYPSFALCTLWFIERLLRTKIRSVVIVACGAQVIASVGFIVLNHPFQQVYFNALVSHSEERLNRNYQLDYWGCSFKQGLDYLVGTDKSDTIKIALSVPPLYNNIMMLKPEDRKRILVIDDMAATDYMLIDNRAGIREDFARFKTVYSVKVQNSTVMSVYKLR